LASGVIKLLNYPVFLIQIYIREECRVKKSLKLIVAAAGLLTISATASAFSTAPCKACHRVDRDVVGPAWKRVAEKYGSEAALAKVFKSGFKVEDRKIASTEPKFKNQASIMTGQFNHLIKGHEDEAAKALFAAVKAGKI
jgi:cytochrome c551/c552